MIFFAYLLMVIPKTEVAYEELTPHDHPLPSIPRPAILTAVGHGPTHGWDTIYIYTV